MTAPETPRGELFERAATAMIVVESAMAVVDANPAAARLLGDATLEECVAARDLPALRAALAHADEVALTVRARCVDGERLVDVDGARLDDGTWLLSLHARRERPRAAAWEHLLARVEPAEREGARHALELLWSDPGALQALVADVLPAMLPSALDARPAERPLRARTGPRAARAAGSPARRLRIAS